MTRRYAPRGSRFAPRATGAVDFRERPPNGGLPYEAHERRESYKRSEFYEPQSAES